MREGGMHAMVGLALWLGLALASGNVERELDGVGSASARLMALDGSRTLIVSRGGSSRDTRVVLLDANLEAQWDARVHISMEAPPLLKRRSLARLAPGIGDVPRAGSQVLVQRGDTLNVLTTWGRRVVHHRVTLASGAVERTSSSKCRKERTAG